MKKTNKEKVKEFIRVDHAGERGAVKIYEGQLLALNTWCRAWFWLNNLGKESCYVMHCFGRRSN